MAKAPSSSPAPNKGRGTKKAAPVVEEAVEINLPDEMVDAEPITDPLTGATIIHHADKSITIDYSGDAGVAEDAGPGEHLDNLVERISENEQARIADELLEAIDSDKSDRSQWLTMRAKAIELMGLKLEDPKSDVSTSTAGMGMSVVRDPIVAEAVYAFQANSYGELCPSSGPVKVRSFDDKLQKDNLAQALEDDLNYYFTTTASEYYPNTREMLFWTGLASGTFKKVYTCPIKRRPVSLYVDGTNLILPANATDVKNAGRVTHEISMRRSVLRRMQIIEAYADIDLGEPMPTQTNAVDQKKASSDGIQATPSRPEDQDYTIYECYCELDIKGFEHEEDGEITGLPLPYKVTLEETSRKILEIRRNWAEDDKECEAKIPFVLFPYATGMSVYGTGLGQILGNTASALTALTREAIDLLMFNNFPGFLYANTAGTRNLTNEFRVPPGGGAPIETGGLPIGQVAMPLPYPPLSPATIAFIEQLRAVGQRLGGTANTPVGESKQDAPVGTTIALIEQATKVEGSVHKALHAAQAEEFSKIIDLFKEDPEALWRGNKRPALGKDKEERVAKFQQALNDWSVVPMADPNTPSHMHRLMKGMALKQLQAANPALYDARAVDSYIGDMMKMDVQQLFVPPQPPNTQPDPALLIEMEKVKQGGMKLQIENRKIDVDAEQKDKDRRSNETIETLKIAQALAVHPESNEIVDDQLLQMAPFLHPVTGEEFMPMQGPETIQ